MLQRKVKIVKRLSTEDAECIDVLIRFIDQKLGLSKLYDVWIKQHLNKEEANLTLLRNVRICNGQKPWERKGIDMDDVAIAVRKFLEDQLGITKELLVDPLATIKEFRDTVLKRLEGHKIGSRDLFGRYRQWCDEYYGDECGAISITQWGILIRDNKDLFVVTRSKGLRIIHNYI